MTLTPDQDAQIAEQRAQLYQTRRPVSAGLEERLYEAIPVLDHGFVRVVDYMGNDAAIVQAARVSYGVGTKQARDDAGLIGYLMRHWHTTPFEMCEIKLHVKLPIFIARQWIRHRTANVNEYSARYSILDKEFYLPQIETLSAQSRHNRQGRGEVLNGAEAERVLEILREDALRNFDHYAEMLNETQTGEIIDPTRKGLARELARANLTLNTYTQWYWKIDLHNLCHFLQLRADAHAQYEIRVYADVICDLVKAWVPMAWAAFENHRLNAVSFSGAALLVVKRMLAGDSVSQETSGLSAGEWRELMQALDLGTGR